MDSQLLILLIVCFLGAVIIRYVANRKTRFADIFIDPGYTLTAMFIVFVFLLLLHKVFGIAL